MKEHGKRYVAVAKLVEEGKAYPPVEAVQLAKQTANVKFDSTVELHMRLGVDPRHADQMVRGTATLPSGTGSATRVLVFAQGDKAREAEEAGADYVGGEDYAKRIDGGWLDFDVAIATPDMMSTVGKLGRILGRRGLMPNPKSGTVTTDVARAVKEVKGGRIEFRVDKTALIHAPIGKASFDEQGLLKNLGSFIDAVVKAKPAGAKGAYVKSIFLTTTMGPGIQLDIQETLALGAGA